MRADLELVQQMMLGWELQMVLKRILVLELMGLLLLELVLWPVPCLAGPSLLTFAGLGIPPHRRRAACFFDFIFASFV